jgi:IS5 family transposase
MQKQKGIFDEQFKLERISELGDPLEVLDRNIDWNIFRYTLNKQLGADEKDKSKGGRPPFDYIMMFKILILQEYFGLSDEQAEFQITDRISFMRFLGLKLFSKVPDHNTIWNFRERISLDDGMKKLFEIFHKELDKQGMILNKGKILDASIQDAPRPRNTKEENEIIKQGELPKEWKLVKNKKKVAQKDLDGRWVKKNNETRFGYKNNIKVDSKSKFIDKYIVTDAAVHDSQPGKSLLSKQDKGQPLYGDSAYTGDEFEKAVKKSKMILRTHEKGYRGKPLTQEQQLSNTRKSKVRALVEHIFGFRFVRIGWKMIRTKGIRRARTKIGASNLTYNLFRYSSMKAKCA